MKEHIKRIVPLSSKESKFLQQLIEDNEKLINVIMFRCLGEMYYILADDAIAQLYLLACEKIDVLLTHENPSGWLVVSAKHVANSLCERYFKENKTVFNYGLLYFKSGYDIFDECLYNTWIKENAVEKLLSKLSKRESEVYQKLYIERKSPSDTAEELGVTINLIYNIKRNLKNKIKKAVEDDDF